MNLFGTIDAHGLYGEAQISSSGLADLLEQEVIKQGKTYRTWLPGLYQPITWERLDKESEQTRNYLEDFIKREYRKSELPSSAEPSETEKAYNCCIFPLDMGTLNKVGEGVEGYLVKFGEGVYSMISKAAHSEAVPLVAAVVAPTLLIGAVCHLMPTAHGQDTCPCENSHSSENVLVKGANLNVDETNSTSMTIDDVHTYEDLCKYIFSGHNNKEIVDAYKSVKAAEGFNSDPKADFYMQMANKCIDMADKCIDTPTRDKSQLYAMAVGYIKQACGQEAKQLKTGSCAKGTCVTSKCNVTPPSEGYTPPVVPPVIPPVIPPKPPCPPEKPPEKHCPVPPTPPCDHHPKDMCDGKCGNDNNHPSKDSCNTGNCDGSNNKGKPPCEDGEHNGKNNQDDKGDRHDSNPVKDDGHGGVYIGSCGDKSYPNNNGKSYSGQNGILSAVDALAAATPTLAGAKAGDAYGLGQATNNQADQQNNQVSQGNNGDNAQVNNNNPDTISTNSGNIDGNTVVADSGNPGNGGSTSSPTATGDSNSVSPSGPDAPFASGSGSYFDSVVQQLSGKS